MIISLRRLDSTKIIMKYSSLLCFYFSSRRLRRRRRAKLSFRKAPISFPSFIRVLHLSALFAALASSRNSVALRIHFDGLSRGLRLFHLNDSQCSNKINNLTFFWSGRGLLRLHRARQNSGKSAKWDWWESFFVFARDCKQKLMSDVRISQPASATTTNDHLRKAPSRDFAFHSPFSLLFPFDRLFHFVERASIKPRPKPQPRGDFFDLF